MHSPYLLRRLQYLYSTERLFAYVFGGLFGYTALLYPLYRVVALLYGLLAITYLLFQGQRYWQVKLARLLGQPFQPAAQLAFFRRAKRLSQGLLLLMPLVGLLQLWLRHWPATLSTGLLVAALANGFAGLEYVNYYHRQLMIDTRADARYLQRRRKLKVASLARDLAAQRL